MAKATFGAGCFWGVESAFRQLKGVTEAAVGYAGGTLENPTYQDVCTDSTGHAEVVEVDFDPAQISYEELVRAFFELHDPTTLNRQGPDFGRQYRSVIFCHDAEQEAVARKIADELDAAGKFPRKIVTQIAAAPEFYRGEEYHQRYFQKKGIDPTCHIR
jgi:peptide-methionine (S)-S-oxide reductase